MADEVFALLGPESGQKEEFLTQLRKRIKEKAGEPPEEHRFYPFKSEYKDLVAILRNTALFAKHRLVILNQAHEIKKKADVEILRDYCLSPVKDATLVLISDDYQINRRLADAIPKDNKKIFWELFENQKRAWIGGFFRKAGMSIEPDAVELILELVENDTQDLQRECQRLADFLSGTGSDGPGGAVTVSRVEELIYHSKSESVFTLFDRIARGNFSGSLEILQSIQLSGEGDPAKILGGLTWQIRRLLAMRRLLDRRYSREDACKKLNIRGKKNQATYAEGCVTYNARQLAAMLAAIATYEADLRSGGGPLQDTYLQKFIFDAVVKKGAADRGKTFQQA